MTSTLTQTGSRAEPLLSPPSPPRHFGKAVVWAIVLAMLATSWQGADMRPLDFFRDAGNMRTYAASFFPPDFHDWRIYLSELLVTLQIAVWGTALAVVFAVPFGLLSSSNIAPAWVTQPVRRVMDAARAINEMVFAMLFVVAVGLGPFAGVLACWRYLYTPLEYFPNCFRKRLKPLTRNQLKEFARPAPMRLKKSSSVCCHK